MKKTMTLNLTEQEMIVLEKLADAKGLSKTALIRQALRLYQTINERIERGDKLQIAPPGMPSKTELLII